jgi:CheY-like chemotaxis protein
MIFFVDDDRRYIKDYVEEIESRNYSVIHEYNIDDAFKSVVEHIQNIQLLILDVMMPPGELLDERDNENGKRTGILFIKAIEEQIGEINFPLIIFTHVNINILDGRYQNYQKEDYTPYDFADKIEQIVNCRL